MVETFDGPGWTEQSADPAGATFGSEAGDLLTGVRCTGPGACLAAGWNNASGSVVVEQLAGSTWTGSLYPAGVNDFSTGWDVSGVCFSATACVEAGTAQTGSGAFVQTVTLSGSTVTASTPMAPGGAQARVFSVSCVSATSCVAVGGIQGTSGDLSLIGIYKSRSWTLRTGPPEGRTVTGVDLLGVSCPAAGSCVAVGDLTTTSGGRFATVDTQ